ncbi:hypothetical protein GCM10009738_71240 [Kitasatospora viridis]
MLLRSALAPCDSPCAERKNGFGTVSMCPQMDTAIQIGPTGKKLLPLTVVNQGTEQPKSAHV